MKNKLLYFLTGVLVAIFGYHFAGDIKQLIISPNEGWIKYVLLITTAVNTSLIVYILRLTKHDNDKGNSS